MSTPLPAQSILGFGIDATVSLLTVTSLLVAITFTVLAFAHYNTYIRLLDEHNQAIWLSENILPIIEEDDAAQGAQESASTEFSKSIVRYVSFHFPRTACQCSPVMEFHFERIRRPVGTLLRFSRLANS